MARAQVRLERVFKGVANHRRIEMLQLLEREPELSLGQIAERCRIDLPNASEHVRKLALAGLVWKSRRGREVRHTVSGRGRKVLAFACEL